MFTYLNVKGIKHNHQTTNLISFMVISMIIIIFYWCDWL